MTFTRGTPEESVVGAGILTLYQSSHPWCSRTYVVRAASGSEKADCKPRTDVH